MQKKIKQIKLTKKSRSLIKLSTVLFFIACGLIFFFNIALAEENIGEKELTDDPKNINHLKWSDAKNQTKNWPINKGTEEDPFRIESPEDLAAFSKWSNENPEVLIYVILERDLDLSKYFWDIPINMTGFFNGNNHQIIGLKIDSSELESQNQLGLFGIIKENSKVENLTIKGEITILSVLDSIKNIGGIAKENRGTIKNCKSNVLLMINTLENSEINIGGIAGINKGTVVESVNQGDIKTNTGIVGGLVGYNANGEIERSINIGNLENAQGILGGLIGISEGDLGGLHKSFNDGSLTGVGNIGGLIGKVLENGIVENSYNHGSITSGLESLVGGIVGQLESGEIRNVYNSGEQSNGGGICGLNNGIIENAYYDQLKSEQVKVAITEGEKSQNNVKTLKTWQMTRENPMTCIVNQLEKGYMLGFEFSFEDESTSGDWILSSNQKETDIGIEIGYYPQLRFFYEMEADLELKELSKISVETLPWSYVIFDGNGGNFLNKEANINQNTNTELPKSYEVTWTLNNQLVNKKLIVKEGFRIKEWKNKQGESWNFEVNVVKEDTILYPEWKEGNIKIKFADTIKVQMIN